MPDRVSATPQAAATIRAWRRRTGRSSSTSRGAAATAAPRCACSPTSCPPGPDDVLLGEVAGTPFYIDGDQDRRWDQPAIVVDVAPGGATSLSLEGALDCTSSP